MTTDQTTIRSLISPQDGLGFKIELFDLIDPVPFHYHMIQTQYLVVLEGELGVLLKDCHIDLKEGESITVPPHTFHSLIPHTFARFAIINIPGFTYPEDVYTDSSCEQEFTYLTSQQDKIDMPDVYRQSKISQPGYTVYPLAIDPKDNRWELAILDIHDSPKHFHQLGSEHFLVLNGELIIELNNKSYYLSPGHSVHILPKVKHHLCSAAKSPVRVLCISFPAFNIEDFHHV